LVAEHITIEHAEPAEATLLANLLELYIHDLSEVFAIEPGPDGRFGYPALPRYWSEPEQRFPFLVRADGKAVGFALLTRGSPASDDPDVLDVAEFFVLRRHRRSGCGRRAAVLLFDRFPGRWLVRVSEGNRGAMPFWESVVSTYTRGEFTQSRREGSTHTWRDFSFRVPVERGLEDSELGTG
jgi:predicted acetyltransferase